MTHSHDRTMLARLGFSDPDKQDPLHDLACRYLVRPTVASKLVRKYMNMEDCVPANEEADVLAEYLVALGPDHPGPRHRKRYEKAVLASEVAATGRGEVEKHLTKGEGKYRTTIGFIDAVITGKAKCSRMRSFWVNGTDEADSGEGADVGHGFAEGFLETPTVYCEVKIAPVPVGDLVRQIKLYASHVGDELDWRAQRVWLAALAYAISEQYAETLAGEGIKCLRLGADFDAYVKSSREAPPALLDAI